MQTISKKLRLSSASVVVPANTTINGEQTEEFQVSDGAEVWILQTEQPLGVVVQVRIEQFVASEGWVGRGGGGNNTSGVPINTGPLDRGIYRAILQAIGGSSDTTVNLATQWFAIVPSVDLA